MTLAFFRSCPGLCFAVHKVFVQGEFAKEQVGQVFLEKRFSIQRPLFKHFLLCPDYFSDGHLLINSSDVFCLKCQQLRH